MPPGVLRHAFSSNNTVCRKLLAACSVAQLVVDKLAYYVFGPVTGNFEASIVLHSKSFRFSQKSLDVTILKQHENNS